MGKSQKRRLELASANFRKAIRAEGLRVANIKFFMEKNYKATKLEYGDTDKSQQKSSRSSKRIRSKQMA